MDCKVVDISKEYKAFDFVDEGGFGRVYKVVDNDEKVFALKVLTAKKDSFPADFARELRCLMRLRDHPNIVRMHKAFVASGIQELSASPAFTMDYLPVTMFKMSIKQPVGLPVSFIAKFSRDVACGLVYTHEMGFIHRDLSLRNVLLDAKLTAKIADFGASREVSMSNMSGGCTTVNYRAPELTMKRNIYSTAADNWSLGTMILDTVENRFVFLPKCMNEDNAEFKTFQIVRHVVDLPGYKSIKAPEKIIPNTMRHAVIKAVVFALLEPRPADRMTAQELLNDEEWSQLAHITEDEKRFVSERYWECTEQCNL